MPKQPHRLPQRKLKKSRIAAPSACHGEAQRERGQVISKRLEEHYGDPRSALAYRNPFELLIAVILSAQTTDESVNRVTPTLFEHFGTAEALATADPEKIEGIIRPTGFFRQKTKSVIATSQALVAEHSGKVPETMDELVALRGVARKTANIVLGTCFGIVEGIAVDTHVFRLAHRLGLSEAADANRVEGDLCACLERGRWYRVNFDLITHGRRVCTAKKPVCGTCFLNDLCPTAFTTAGWRAD